MGATQHRAVANSTQACVRKRQEGNAGATANSVGTLPYAIMRIAHYSIATSDDRRSKNMPRRRMLTRIPSRPIIHKMLQNLAVLAHPRPPSIRINRCVGFQTHTSSCKFDHDPSDVSRVL